MNGLKMVEVVLEFLNGLKIVEVTKDNIFTRYDLVTKICVAVGVPKTWGWPKNVGVARKCGCGPKMWASPENVGLAQKIGCGPTLPYNWNCWICGFCSVGDLISWLGSVLC